MKSNGDINVAVTTFAVTEYLYNNFAYLHYTANPKSFNELVELIRQQHVILSVGHSRKHEINYPARSDNPTARLSYRDTTGRSRERGMPRDPCFLITSNMISHA